MTTSELTPSVEERLIASGLGADEAYEAFRMHDFDKFIERLGLRGLNFIIAKVLDDHYPESIFSTGTLLYPSWASEHGGEDIQPGIKWAAFLRAAIEEINRAERE